MYRLMNAQTSTLITILRERVDALRQGGDLDEALHAAGAAIERAQYELNSDFDSIDTFASSLEIRADILRELGRFDLARDDYRQAIDQLDSRMDRLDQIGRLHAGLGAVYDAQGDEVRAAIAWEKAIDCFEKHEPPMLLDIASLANNLGMIRKNEGNQDAAETYFLRALEILHTHVEGVSEEAAAVSNNLGALYLAAGFTEQAREMHMMALEARRELFGELHADTAQSHNNLALALLQTGDRAWAKRHFEKSLAAFEALGVQYSDDLEAVSSNYCDFLREDGEAGLADVIDQRVQASLGRV